MSEIDLDQPTPKGVSRRTVAKAMAWAVPVVAIAAPAPAFAVSGKAPTICPGVGCKLPGNSGNGCADVLGFPTLDANKGFAFPLEITNNDDLPIVIQSITMVGEIGGKTFTSVGFSQDPIPPVQDAPDNTVTVVWYANGSDSNQAGGTATIVVEWGHDLSDDDHDPIEIQITIDTFGVCAEQYTDHWFNQNTCSPDFYPNGECVTG